MLRFDNLQIPPPKDPKDLERMLQDLSRAELADPFVQPHGRSGQSQHGVDLVGLPRHAVRPFGIQAKEKDSHLGAKLTEKELKEEARKARGFHPGLGVLILATTSARDGELQRAALDLTLRNRRKKLFDIQIWFWEDICTMLQKHQHIAADYYPHLFPEAAKKAKRRGGRHASPSAPSFLSLELMRVVALVAVAPGPVFSSHFTEIFPSVLTKSKIGRLTTLGFLSECDGIITVPEAVAREIRKEKELCKEILALWETSLAPLEAHVDLALYQAALYVRTNRVQKGVELLSDVAQGLEPGSWNARYLRILKPLDKPKLLSKLSGAGRVQLLNALGLCCTRNGKHKESLEYFDRLLHEAHSAGDKWGIGQALIHKGVAYNALGDDIQSRECYARAVTHAKRSKDDTLLGRALHNLAQLLVDESPDRAQEYLRLSAAAKRRAKDFAGEVGTVLTQGLIHSRRREYSKAEGYFKRADRLAKKNDQRFERAIALCDLGRVNLDLKRYKKSQRYYVRAEKLCSEEHFSYPRDLALEGIALSYELQGDLESAAKYYAKLSLDDKARYPIDSRLRAGVRLTAIHSATGAHGEAWEDVLRLSRQTDDIADPAPLLQAVQLLLTSESARGRGKRALTTLSRVAKKLGVKGSTLFPATLEAGLTGWKLRDDEATLALKILNLCRLAWKKADNVEGELRAMQLEASWAWQLGGYDVATKILTTALSLSRSKKCLEQEGLISKQLADCFQELEDHNAAESHYCRSIEIAKAVNHSGLLVETCNNLGELLRRAGRPKEAIKWLTLSENASLADHSFSEAISTRHNRALALHGIGEKRKAKALLKDIYRKALSLNNAPEAVRALHGLAILAEVDSPPGASIPLFKRALKEAESRNQRSETILYNLSSALRRADRAKEAAPLVQRAVDTWKREPNWHRRLRDAGIAWEEASAPKNAKVCWAKLRQEAKRSNDPEFVAIAAASLARIAQNRRQFKEAAKLLREAMKYEANAEDRVLLRMDEIRLAVEAKWQRRLTKLYPKFNNEVQGHPDQCDLQIDLHMLLGDYAWSQPKYRLRAVEAYTAASAFASLSLNPDAIGSVFVHFVKRLIFPRPAKPEECEKRLQYARDWIKRQKALKTLDWLHDFLLGPLKVAVRVSRENIDVSRLNGNSVQALFEEEAALKESVLNRI